MPPPGSRCKSIRGNINSNFQLLSKSASPLFRTITFNATFRVLQKEPFRNLGTLFITEALCRNWWQSSTSSIDLNAACKTAIRGGSGNSNVSSLSRTADGNSCSPAIDSSKSSSLPTDEIGPQTSSGITLCSARCDGTPSDIAYSVSPSAKKTSAGVCPSLNDPLNAAAVVGKSSSTLVASIATRPIVFSTT